MIEIIPRAIMPQAIGLVVTKMDKVNLCPVNWQVVSTKYEKPAVVCIGLSNSSYSLEAIIQNREFVFSYPSEKQLEDTLYCGTVSGRDIDKVFETRFTFFDSEKVTPPCLQEAVVNFECFIREIIEVGNYSIVIGLIERISMGDKATQKIYSFGDRTYGTVGKPNILQKGR